MLRYAPWTKPKDDSLMGENKEDLHRYDTDMSRCRRHRLMSAYRLTRLCLFSTELAEEFRM